MSTEAILLDLALIFTLAKVFGYLFERLRQPPVIGELLAGILFGPHLLGLIGESHTHEVFQELGAIILLFAVGLDTPLSELKVVGGRALAVGGSGIVLPFAIGFALLALAGGETAEALFLGTAMVATSVGVTARVLADLGRIREPESRVILGAAVVDDVLGLLVLAIVAGSVTGDITIGSVLLLAGLAIGFVILVGGLGAQVVNRATPLLDRMGQLRVFTIALALCLALSATAGALNLAAIIGAFLAGMAFAETRDRYKLEERLTPVYSFLVPFFFVVTGTFVDLSVFADPRNLVLGLAVIVLAIAGKLVGCGVAAAGMGRRSALIVGTGMVPRGEVGILVASIGLAEGIIGDDLYGIVVMMSVVTTIVVPPALTALFKDRPERTDHTPHDHARHTHEIEGIGG
ncbi:MAG: cation:proton antiporter [Actinomycetota bacterium]|nr:cation:proton antiporter [Actinomycetota bacterium]